MQTQLSVQPDIALLVFFFPPQPNTWCIFQHYFPNFPTLTRHSIIQFNSDSKSPELGSADPTSLRAQSRKTAFTSQINYKCQLPSLPSLLSDLATKLEGFSQTSSPLRFDNCQNDSQNQGKCFPQLFILKNTAQEQPNGKRCIAQDMGRVIPSFHALSDHATLPATPYLQPRRFLNPIYWEFLWRFHHGFS